jgi:hypothetical protein
MRIISFLALIIAIVSLIVGVYCQVIIVPKYNASLLGDSAFIYYSDMKFLLGIISLFGGITAALLGLITGIKKQRIGWFAFLISIVPIILGLLQATHVFS